MMRRIAILSLTLALIVVILIAITVGIGYALISRAPIQIEEGAVLEIRLSGTLDELPRHDVMAQFLGFETMSLWEIGKVLQYAAQDKMISGVYLQIHSLNLSWAQIEELRDYMKDFRNSKKPLHAFLALDMVRDPELYLATAADSITLNPDAGFLVNGLLAEVTFYKKTMEKLGIKPEFIQFKEYKSPEPLSRNSMTPEIREMYKSILEDIQSRLVSAISEDRNVSEESIKEVFRSGVSSSTKAVEKHLIDTLGYENEVHSKFISDHVKKYHGVMAKHYLKLAEDQFTTRSEYKIALVGGLGAITSGNSDPFSATMGGMTTASHLRKIRANEDFKGVIFRVDSPGGSAVGSDMIWNEIILLEEEGKPVVVSMSGVAGSGGYYISMAARKIISHPSTITGSIGVIFGKFNMENLYEWLGITVDQVKTSPNADILSTHTSLNEEHRKNVESWMENIYKNFVGKASEGRQIPYDILEPLARGRIYTGVQAKNLALVDELGGMQTAVKHMKEALALKKEDPVEIVLYPRSKTLWEQLISGDLLQIRKTPSITQWLQEQLPFLSNPTPRMLMPEATIY
ncbi:MAG: signal peptide peptidase SppA [Acidobacteriota bacterium]|nr:signal peptide peptidase SppA [Acidobacteriota bacterium]